MSEGGAFGHDFTAEHALVIAPLDGQRAIYDAVHSAITLAIDVPENEVILTRLVLDQERAFFEADGGDVPGVGPLAVGIAVTLEVDRAGSRLPLAVIGEAVGLALDHDDGDACVAVFGAQPAGQRLGPAHGLLCCCFLFFLRAPDAGGCGERQCQCTGDRPVGRHRAMISWTF